MPGSMTRRRALGSTRAFERFGLTRVIDGRWPRRTRRARPARAARYDRALATLGRRAVEGDSVEAVGQAAVALAAEALDASMATFFAIEAEGLILRAGVGWPDGGTPVPVPISPDSQAAYLVDSPDGAVVVPDLRAETRFTPAALLLDRGVRSSAGVRIGSRGDRHGILSVHSDRVGDLTESDLVFLTELATLVATAFERQRHLEAVRHAALHDGLTGIVNRRGYDLALAQHPRAGVVLVDIDHFKEINDTFGHHVGDAVLCETAARMIVDPPPGSVIARIGGDEFAMVVPPDSTGRVDLATTVSEMVTRLEAPMTVDDARLSPTVSVGHSAGASSQHNARHADQALYAAKRAGRARAVAFCPTEHRDLADRAEIAGRLRAAVDAEALTVHFQPIVDLETGRFVRVEALARWTDQDRVVPADEFVALAEEIGVIGQLGLVVLGRALAELGTWPVPLNDLPLSVNVSPLQLTDARFVEQVLDAVAEAATDPSRLTLEITGSGLMDDDRCVETLSALRQAGVGVAIGNDGLPASSVTRLAELPITEVKLDATAGPGRRGLTHNPRLLAALVALAEALDATVVAERIESADQLATARAARCSRVQGYFLCPPMPGRDLVERWAAQNRQPCGT